MPSLAWILALTLTFLHCLSAFPTNDPRIQRARETLSQIETLAKISCPTANSTFYINSDVQGDDISQMLECATKELKVVAEECFWNDNKHYAVCYRTVDTIETILKGGQNGQIQDEPPKIQCEAFGKKPYMTFLSDLKILIQKQNNKL